MGMVLIKIKLMPSSPKEDLNKIKEKAKEIVESEKGTKVSFEEEPIAFGLKAIIISFEQNEDEGKLEPIENSLREIENINSVQVTDMRRAFG